MNIGKLLAAGKSIMNGRTEISYRFNKQTYLPKFESPKNPFIAPAKAKTENLAPAKKEAVATKTQKLPVAPTKIEPAIGWTSKLNPISMLRPTPSQAKSQEPVVQSELSLDAVKVVHNDLTDADVEVVPIKSRPAAPDLPPPKKSWEILGERLLKVTAL